MSGSLRVILAIGPAMWLLTAQGCAGTPPKEALASADTMVKRAEAEGAPEFAPLPMREARDKLERAQTEMKKEDYDRARRLATPDAEESRRKGRLGIEAHPAVVGAHHQQESGDGDRRPHPGFHRPRSPLVLRHAPAIVPSAARPTQRASQ